MTVPFGGRCFDSAQLVCQDCLTQCALCGKPICREHAFAVEGAYLCKQHAGEVRRGRLLRRSVRALLSPFVEFEEERSS